MTGREVLFSVTSHSLKSAAYGRLDFHFRASFPLPQCLRRDALRLWVQMTLRCLPPNRASTLLCLLPYQPSLPRFHSLICEIRETKRGTAFYYGHHCVCLLLCKCAKTPSFLISSAPSIVACRFHPAGVHPARSSPTPLLQNVL